MIVRIVAQIALFSVLAFGAAGVMLGNGISYVVCLIISAWLLREKVGPLGLGRTVGTLAKVAVAMIGSGAVAFGVVAGMRALGIDSAWAQTIVGGVVILGGYLALAKVLRVDEIDEVLTLMGRLRRKVLGR